ncbi:30S ribosomal protein S6 [Paremcibacter congregatus]|jgi:small subunit ribosomal protein S6|uniref:Small ribosomal subunit protein bS6 n=1 Tax=Paremcibacter congregatus TaxID=2043170 RepID=A0A2G4YUT0_9PROT|nr:30S ribosomal protein S6 [Paremcibacter congregatus]PHZ86088.1 30S ribosomal protein S6 [Paremcibacter congregatus]QDE27054.1 30S ribosomal protein S6 [Paremcibacter congregatus]|tara:strand:+ start:3358 stop:3789 length:432 start_codon:yes stop_codon:yes gene_type:complete
MALYEHIIIARQDIQPQQVEAITSDLTKIITDNGGTVTKTEQWGLRALAYRIKKYKKGHYVLMNIDAPASAVAELERNERLHEDLVRFMTIRVEEHEEGDSVVLRSKDREGRPSRFENKDGGRPPRFENKKPADAPAAEAATE